MPFAGSTTQFHFNEIVNDFRCSLCHDSVYINYSETVCVNRLRDTKQKVLNYNKPHHSILVFHSEPTVAQEVEFLSCLHVMYHDVFQIPGCVVAFARIIMPDSQIVQIAQRPEGQNYTVVGSRISQRRGR